MSRSRSKSPSRTKKTAPASAKKGGSGNPEDLNPAQKVGPGAHIPKEEKIQEIPLAAVTLKSS